MNDPLLARALLAIEESQALRNHDRALRAEQVHAHDELRLSVFESAMYRAEMNADNREP